MSTDRYHRVRHVLVQKLGRVDTGTSGHRGASLRVGCGRFLEESRGDRTHVCDRAITTTHTTLLDATARSPTMGTDTSISLVARGAWHEEWQFA